MIFSLQLFVIYNVIPKKKNTLKNITLKRVRRLKLLKALLGIP